MIWQLQTAKARLSEVLRRAREEGPQTITVRGKDQFVVLTREAYEEQRPFPATEALTLPALFREAFPEGVAFTPPARGPLSRDPGRLLSLEEE